MRIAIIGYGKMGHEIEEAARQKEMDIVTIDRDTGTGKKVADFKEINEQSLKDVDVCIDFTHPDSAVENIKKISALGKNIVMGTTGWYNHMDEVKKIIKDTNIGFIWSGNFSIGVNMFFRMVESAAKVVNSVEDYDIFLHEFHHKNKADKHSGTAEMIAKILVENISRKDKVLYNHLGSKINDNELHVSSTRCGNIPGTHIVGFDSLADTIELKHTARNRKGFALGAVLAAEFIHGKKGFFNIDDMMKEIIK